MKWNFSALFFLLLYFFGIFNLLAQDKQGDPVINNCKIYQKIQIDGHLDEAAWLLSDTATDFWMSVPYDTARAITRTVVRLIYDDDFIYVGATCFDDLPNRDYVIQSLKRDFSYPVTDGFGIYFDPFNDKSNGFAFTCNPYGVQREGLLANSGLFGVSTDWDNRWKVETTRLEDRWIAEMAIPFKSIRYKKGIDSWRVNFSRNNLKRNEGSAWSKVPRTYNIASLLHTGILQWEQAPKNAGMNISIIPYVINTTTWDYGTDKSQNKFNGGGDAKVAVTSSLNLDLTVNPDFSQVEVDRQQTNLSRFNLFYPEKRNFFIENSDLFGEFGFSKIRPFFSRNIGLYQGNAIPIYGGVRLSGKLDQNWRIGIMDLQTKESVQFDQPGYNYAVAAIQRRVLQKSNVGMIFVNRQSMMEGELSPSSNGYHRLVGLDFNYTSKNNLVNGKLFYHHIFNSGIYQDKSSTAAYLAYKTKNVYLEYNHEYVGEDYIPVVGYLGYDPGYLRFEPKGSYTFYPEFKKVLNHGPGFYVSQYWNSGMPSNAESFFIGHPLDGQYQLNYIIKWQTTATLSFYYNHWYTYLKRPYDPSGRGMLPLEQNTSYEYNNGIITFVSNFRKKLNYQFSADYGSYYNGTKRTISGALNLRVQPIAIISATFERNEIILPSPYSNGYLTLIGPKFEFAFTRSLFFTTFVQYNTQIHNLNINARFQWRFSPMSDFYIVYTDNYLAPDFTLSESQQKFYIKNRGVVFKLNYWFTM